MATERKCTTKAVGKKIEILDMLQDGKIGVFAANEYSIAPATVRHISEHKENVQKYIETNKEARYSTERLKTACKTNLEKALFEWCILCWGKNIETSAAVIHNKALELNEKLKGNSEFNANNEWVTEFMERYHVSERGIQIFRNRNVAAAEIFKMNFESYLKSVEYKLENIYNVAYTGLMWRTVPRHTCIFRNEKSMVCPKMYEDHVTVVLCTNASGCHKLPALIIAKCSDSRNCDSMNINSPSIMYEENYTAFMTNNIYHKWFQQCFLKSVTQRQSSLPFREDTFLLVDTTRWYFDFDGLQLKDKFVTMKCFPYYAVPNLQPMDCGIIKCFKIMYRIELLETLLPLPNWNTQDIVIKNHKDLILWDCCRMIQAAWSKVERTLLKVSWSKLLLNENIGELHTCTSIIEKNVQQIHALLDELPGCDNFTRYDLENWFEIDQKEKIYMKLCTEEICKDVECDTQAQKNTGSFNKDDELLYKYMF